MSSSPLYLAIVAVWAVVLIPMLLRRDAADTTWIPRRAASAEDGTEDGDDEGEHLPPADDEPFPSMGEGVATDPGEALAEPDAAGGEAPLAEPYLEGNPGRPMERPLRRATVIARRRRRTAGLVLLLLLTVGAASLGLGPWWVMAPPAVLLAGHVALLREAAKVDAERRAAARGRRIRARRAAAERRRAEAERKAEVIELASRRRGVYDQYADAHRRAAGD